MESCEPKASESSANAAAMQAAPARCLRCGVDLSRLPDAARYCPRCGLDTHASPPAALLRDGSADQDRLADLLGGWKHLTEFHRSAEVPEPPINFCRRSEGATSEILEGYANAMYNLGRRYESGRGTGSNPREALRCYCKSARLGNLWALARLAAHWMASRDPFERSEQQRSTAESPDA